MKAMGVTTIHAVATAAVRRARNAAEFTVPAEVIIGRSIEVLSQVEEAHFVSQGLTLNIPEATGFVADLGGGSLGWSSSNAAPRSIRPAFWPSVHGYGR